MFLHKDGITVEALSPTDIAKLKGLGYTEVVPMAPATEEKPVAKELTPEEQNAAAIKEVDKFAGSGSRKAGGKA